MGERKIEMPERVWLDDWKDPHEAAAIEYIRSDLAAERERGLKKLLLYAECPECDGSGVKEIDAGGELAQCQWCCERDEALATHEHNEGES